MTAVRRLGVVAALVVAATAAVVLPAGGASADDATQVCSGVLVVIDYGALGGSTAEGCVTAQADAADDVTAAGHVLTNAQQFAGMVCRIDGLPTDQACVTAPPADAYWALYWTTGRSGRWVYASLGAYALSVPKGGAVAFAWQDGTTATPPDVAAPKTVVQHPSVSPRPSVTPTPRASHTPSHASSRSPSTRPSPSVRPAKKKRHRHVTHSSAPSPTPSASTPSPSASAGSRLSRRHPTSTVPTADETRPSGGLPGWIAPALVIVVIGGSGYAVRRRRHR